MSTFYSLSLQCGSLTGSGRSSSRASGRVGGGRLVGVGEINK